MFEPLLQTLLAQCCILGGEHGMGTCPSFPDTTHISSYACSEAPCDRLAGHDVSYSFEAQSRPSLSWPLRTGGRSHTGLSRCFGLGNGHNLEIGQPLKWMFAFSTPHPEKVPTKRIARWTQSKLADQCSTSRLMQSAEEEEEEPTVQDFLDVATCQEESWQAESVPKIVRGPLRLYSQ